MGTCGNEKGRLESILEKDFFGEKENVNGLVETTKDLKETISRVNIIGNRIRNTASILEDYLCMFDDAVERGNVKQIEEYKTIIEALLEVVNNGKLKKIFDLEKAYNIEEEDLEIEDKDIERALGIAVKD